MRITFKQMEIFVAVATLGNMSLAAKSVYISQSACSMALSAMENQLGGNLFDRHGKKLFLNERGRVLFPKAANIIGQVKELENLMTEKKGGALSGHLRIGASTTIGNYLLPKMIGRFITRHPEAKITLQVANTEQIIQQILKFNIDLGLIEGRCHSDEITTFPWRKDRFVVIASPKHPLCKKRKISAEDLYQAKWILREPGSGTREKFAQAMGGKINPFLELGDTEAIKQAVQAGLGIGFLSEITVTELLKNGKLVALKTPFLDLIRNFYIIIHQDKYKTTLLSEFIKLCEI